MKRIYKSLLLLTVVLTIAMVYTSCKKETAPEPIINYVRITNPASSDSLLIGAFQGNFIAIVGENLQDATEMWFNDQPAVLNPTYVTSKTIITNVPSKIPKKITNKIKILFSTGKVLEYNFKVQISEPTVSSMNCEYVATGEEATILGNYFYEPISVTFAGGVKGEVTSITDKILKVKVPVGAEPGQITITTNFGETKSDFWFRDNRNIYLSSDPFTGWWNASYVITPASIKPEDPPSINGNYIRVKKTVGAWAWTEVAGGPASAMGDISKNIPDDAILKPSAYNLKFEVNTMKPYINNVLKINVGLLKEFNDGYQWAPPYDTKGKWQTVTIPFEDIAKSYTGITLALSPTGYWARLLFHGPGELDCDMSLDNFRVVPKVIKK